jgi:hypothetical protein
VHKPGDSVKAVITSVKRDEQKVSFSLKPSRLPAPSEASDADSDEEGEEDDEEDGDEGSASDDLQIYTGADDQGEEQVEDGDVEMADATVCTCFEAEFH